MTQLVERDAVGMKAELERMAAEGASDPGIRAMVMEAVQGRPDPVAALYDYLHDRVEYRPDPESAELFTHPWIQAQRYWAGQQMHGDCDDMAALVGACLGALGRPYRIVLLDTDMGGEVDHAVCETWIEGIGWITVDISASKGGFPLGWQYRSTVRYE